MVRTKRTNFKSLLIFSFGIIIFSGFLCTCKDDIEPESKYLTINGKEYQLDKGVLDDNGTNDEITYRSYALKFHTSSLLSTETYLTFVIYSNSTSRLEEGTYDYSYSVEKGKISYVQLGKEIIYDETGVATSGIRILEENSTIEGSIIIDMKNENYDIIFDLTIEYNDETYVINGQFNSVLTEGYVSY